MYTMWCESKYIHGLQEARSCGVTVTEWTAALPSAINTASAGGRHAAHSDDNTAK